MSFEYPEHNSLTIDLSEEEEQQQQQEEHFDIS
jgi:hypothetical protein